MREIKFRAWNESRKLMVEWDEVSNSHEEIGNLLTFKNLIPMQYTGIKDKNGKEIYEGDIVKQTYHLITGSYDDQMAYDGHHIGEVIITAYKGVCMRNPLCYSEETDETIKCNQYKNIAGYRCEIIGNIYENPDLKEATP